MTNLIQFNDQSLALIEKNNQFWLASRELSKGLGYADDKSVTKIYNRHKDEFTKEMADGVKLTSTDGKSYETLIFSPRGCHLIAMFARTPFAKDFRKWVLDVLEKKSQITTVANYASVDMKAIGGMVKRCATAGIKEMLSKPADNNDSYYNIGDWDIVQYLQRWYWTRHYDILRISEEKDKRIMDLEYKLKKAKKALS